MYRKIYRGDFKCPSWLSSESRKLITKMLDPNLSTRITLEKNMESSWFRKPVLKRGLKNEGIKEIAVSQDEEYCGKGKEVESLNAFHIISLSEGFNLSPLFEEKERVEREELRFATMRPVSSVISRFEEVAKTKNFDVNKSGSFVRLQGKESGSKGKLGIDADILAVTPSFLVVEVKKSNGETLGYNQFCSKELRPALKDIVWTTSSSGDSLAA